MRALLALFVVSCVIAVCPARSGHAIVLQDGSDVVTNESIVAMTKAGLSPEIIVEKIRVSTTQFDVSTDALIRLKEEQVDDEVIKAMLDADQTVAVATPPDASDPGRTRLRRTQPHEPLPAVAAPQPPPPTPSESGIYWERVPGEQPDLVKLEPSVYTQSRQSGAWKSRITYGVLKTKSKAVLPGSTANLQVAERQPIFYFFFDVATAGLSQAGHGSAATSANEFVLVRMDAKKNSREIVVAEQSALTGSQSGTLDEYIQPFDFERLAPGIYKVMPKKPLTNGEYCFFYGGSPGAGNYGRGFWSGPRVFDFGVRATK